MDARRRLASNIRWLRERRDWSQKELATEAGLSPSTIERLEGAQDAATLDTLSRLADAFEVSIALLVAG